MRGGTMSPMRRPALWVVLFLCAWLALPAAQTRTAQKHFMWAVRHEGAPPTYLVGSLHVLTPDFYPLAPAIEQAFKVSKVLIEEVDLDELDNPLTMLALAGKAMLTDGRTLDQVISSELYKEVVARGEKAGIPIVALDRMKPWMVAVSLTAPALKAAGFETNLGVDKHFFDRAKAAGMERRALETVAYQFDRLDQMTPALQEAMLKSVLADLDTEIANVTKIAQAWSRGEAETIERYLLGAVAETPELYERLLVERNRNWVPAVERCLQERTPCFVVVGAAHLVGPHSLIALLKQKGYSVEQQ
jgi:uncharacterized protein YbaP (TraB family)